MVGWFRNPKQPLTSDLKNPVNNGMNYTFPSTVFFQDFERTINRFVRQNIVSEKIMETMDLRLLANRRGWPTKTTARNSTQKRKLYCHELAPRVMWMRAAKEATYVVELFV